MLDAWGRGALDIATSFISPLDEQAPLDRELTIRVRMKRNRGFTQHANETRNSAASGILRGDRHLQSAYARCRGDGVIRNDTGC